jgi:hypothetical protein
MPNRWLWTWGGVCFGYRQEEWLFTYDGIGVGRFVGDEVYGTSGDYLGELRSTGQEQRLATSNYKKSRVVAAFSPKVESGYERPANRLLQTLYCGYRDFPSPEIFKKMEARGALHSRSEILSTFNTKREPTPGARSNEHTGGQAVATLHQQVPHIEHAMSVDENGLAKLFGTAEQYSDTCELENAASSESNSILATSNLTQPIITLGKSGNEAAPSQADQRAERLRLVLLNIKSRHAKA